MNINSSIQARIRELHCIKTVAVLSADPIETRQFKEFGKIRCRSLIDDIRCWGYAYVPAKGMLDEQKELFVVLNISIGEAKKLCGQYKRSSFVFSEFLDNGTIRSELWEKEDADIPYNKKDNGYVKKEESNDGKMIGFTEASGNLVVSGKQFQYRIPFGVIERANSLFSANIKHLIEVANRKWNGNEDVDSIMDHVIYHVGMSPYLWRKAVTRGFYDN